MERALAGLVVVLFAAACGPADTRPDAVPAGRAVYGAAAGGLRSDVTARLEQLLWDQRAPAYVRSPLWHQIRTTYDARQYEPLWVGTGAPERAAELVAAVCAAEAEGLRSSAYQVGRLGSELDALGGGRDADALARIDLLLTGALMAYGEDLMLGRIAPRSVSPEWNMSVPAASADTLRARLLAGGTPLDSLFAALRPRTASYAGLTAALEELRAVERAGGWPEVPEDVLLRAGVRGPGVDALRRRLAASGDLPAADTAPGRPFDAVLAAAVRRFQARHGLEADGIAGAGTIGAVNVPVLLRIAQVEANLERQRWVPEALMAHYAVVALDDSTVSVYAAGAPVARLRAWTGDSGRAALPPVTADTIDRVTVEGGTVTLSLSRAPGVLLRGAVSDDTVPQDRGGAAVITLPEPLPLAALASGRDTAALRQLITAADTAAIPAALPVFIFDPTVRVRGDVVAFDAGIEGRDVAVANALGPARPRAPERCEALAAAAAGLAGSR